MEQINFVIDEAVRQLRQSLGQIQIADLFDRCTPVISSTLPSTLTQQANLSAILIIIDMTICFIAHAANVVMFDSHLHGNFGALIAVQLLKTPRIS